MGTDGESIRETWEAVRQLEPKERSKALRSLGVRIAAAAESAETLSSDEIGLYTEILLKLIKVTGFPQQFTAAVASLNLKQLGLLGIDPSTVAIVAKKRGSVSTESGCIGAGDRSEFGPGAFTGGIGLAALAEKRKFIVGVGGDGAYPVQLRLVDCPEPILRPAEYKRLLGATDVCQINVPSGTVLVSDPTAVGSSVLSIVVRPGAYDVAIFVIDGREEPELVVVLAEARQHRDNAFTQVPLLDL